MLESLRRLCSRKTRSATSRLLRRSARRRELRSLLEPRGFASQWLTAATGWLKPTLRIRFSARPSCTRLRFESLEARRVLSADSLLLIEEFAVTGPSLFHDSSTAASGASSSNADGMLALDLEPAGLLAATLDTGTLRIIDTAELDNQLTLWRSGNDLVIHDALARFVSAPAGGTLSDNDQTLTISFASMTAIDLALLAGDDQLAIDFAAGLPVPAGGLSVDGGDGSNSLQAIAGDFTTITSTLLNPTSGSFNLDGAVITHHSVSPTLDVGSVSDLAFQLPSGYASGAILQDDGIAGNSLTQLRGDFPQPYFPTVTFANPIGSLSIQRGHAASTLDVATLPDFDAAFEIGTAQAPLRNITFAGEVTLAEDRSLEAFASSQILLDVSFTDIPVSETGSHIAVSGTGNVSLTAARNIVVSHGASITSVDGDITLSANQQSQTTSGQFAGISLANAAISATGTGNIQLNGRGGTTAGSNIGVSLELGANVSTNTGAVTVVGVGGASTGNTNIGVFMRDGFTSVSGGGPVLVDGTGGGSGGSNANDGVYMFEGARIAGAGPSAPVTVLGTGGNSAGSGGTNRGVFLVGAEVVSGGGDVLVVGTGGGSGASSLNQGVLVQLSRITTAETDATLTVRGFGGNPSGTGGNDNSGVAVSGSPSIISSGTGAMLIEGTGGGSGNSSSHHGVAITAGGTIFTADGAAATIRGVAGTSPQSTASRGILVTGGDSNITTDGADVELIGSGGSGTSGTGILITSGGYVSGHAAAVGGTISLTADSIELQSAFAIEAYDYHVQLRPLVAGTLINLGSSDVLGNHPRTLGLTDLELDRIQTERLTIGSAESGTLSISAPITRASATDLTLVSGGEIVFDSGSVQTAGNLNVAASAGVRPLTSGVDVTASQVTFAPDSTLRINVDGTVPGSQYQQLRVAGEIDLSNVSLALTGSATSLSGETFKIVDNSGFGGISGQFTGLPEGSVINDFLGSGLAATITYAGGDGNDVVLSVEQAPESDIYVTTFADVLDANDGFTSLREAILLANMSPRQMTIHLAAGTYLLTRLGSGENAGLAGDLDIVSGSSVNIVGVATDQTVIDASGLVGVTSPFRDRVFDVLTGGTLNLQNLTITGGNVDGVGGGILNAGQLQLQRVTVADNTATASGGGIRNTGTLIIDASEIADNAVALASGTGGGISHGGTDLQISASAFTNNTAHYGGGISSAATTTIVDSFLSGNRAVIEHGAGYGGAIHQVGGTLNLSGSILVDNHAGYGGGIWSLGSTTITASTLTNNAAIYNGGGMVLGSSGAMTLRDSTLLYNTANFGGGLLNTGSTEVINSTFSFNQARNGGGGISSTEPAGTLVVRHSTFFENRADADGDGTGTGGGIRRGDGTITLQNTLVAGNVRGTSNTADDVTGPLTTNSSFNLISDSATAGGLVHGANGNIVGQAGTGTLDANLILHTVLTNNGGPTWTHALVPGSPALNTGDANFNADAYAPSLLHDQRGDGFARVWGGRIDIGAFELQRSSPPVLTLPPAPVEASEGQWMLLSQLPLSLSDSDPASGELTVVFEVAAGGEFERLAGPSQGTINLASATRVEFTGTLDQLNQSDLSLVRFRATGATSDGTVVIDVHVADSGESTSGISGQLMLQAVNEPPVLVPFEDQTASLGQEVMILGTFSDLGLLDQPWTLEVDWDGNGFVPAGTLTEQGNFTIAHTFMAAGSYNVQVRVVDKDGGMSNVESFTIEVATATTATVVHRGLFYNGANNSFLSSPSNTFNSSGAADGAIDSTKQALLSGASSFVNYSNYTRGLNGLVIDLSERPSGTITADDFSFETWNGITTDGFQAITVTPTEVTVLPGQGRDASDRIKIVFADRAVENTWLRITLLANENTGLAEDDVFYFGHAHGDINIGDVDAGGAPVFLAGLVRATSADASAILGQQTTQNGLPKAVPISNPYDLNKDGRITSADYSLVLGAIQAGGNKIKHINA